MTNKLLIVGRSASGKDCVTDYICKRYGLKQLLSYSTRPMRYENEDTHIFITPDESKEIQSTQDVIAYTKIGEYEYFSTYEQFMESDIYIIDPNGVEYMKKHYEQNLLNDGIQLNVAYIVAEDEIRLERALKRCDDIRIYNQRCIDESEQFNKFEDEITFTTHIITNNTEYDALYAIEPILDLCDMYNGINNINIKLGGK